MQLLVLFYAKLGLIQTLEHYLLLRGSAKRPFEQLKTQIRAKGSPKYLGDEGHVLTHIFVLLSPKYVKGHIVTQVQVFLSPYEPFAHFITHKLLVGSPKVLLGQF